MKISFYLDHILLMISAFNVKRTRHKLIFALCNAKTLLMLALWGQTVDWGEEPTFLFLLRISTKVYHIRATGLFIQIHFLWHSIVDYQRIDKQY